jgi:hypothetical protein
VRRRHLQLVTARGPNPVHPVGCLALPDAARACRSDRSVGVKRGDLEIGRVPHAVVDRDRIVEVLFDEFPDRIAPPVGQRHCTITRNALSGPGVPYQEDVEVTADP